MHWLCSHGRHGGLHPYHLSGTHQEVGDGVLLGRRRRRGTLSCLRRLHYHYHKQCHHKGV